MTLPKITLETIETKGRFYAQQKETLDQLWTDLMRYNEELGVLVKWISESKVMDGVDPKEAYAIGMMHMWDMLKTQSESDELERRFG